MYQDGESVFYYITMYNEDYAMPAMPEGIRDGIVRGIYKIQECKAREMLSPSCSAAVQFSTKFLRAQDILAEKYCVQTDVWSVTSYNELRREALGDLMLEPAAPCGA